jgi:hypothetical protein
MSRAASCPWPRSSNTTVSGPPGSGERPGLLPRNWKRPACLGGEQGLPIQNRPATSRTYLIATACLAGGLVSVGLAVTEIAEYVKHNRVDNLAILGMVIGGLAGFTAAVVNDEKPPGWAGRINTVAVWLAVTGFSSLLFFYGGQHGWWTHSG